MSKTLIFTDDGRIDVEATTAFMQEFEVPKSRYTEPVPAIIEPTESEELFQLIRIFEGKKTWLAGAMSLREAEILQSCLAQRVEKFENKPEFQIVKQ